MERREVPPPALPPGECRIAVRLAGICRTDLELAKGYMGFTGIPGHEFVGTVLEGPENLQGRRVVGEINVPRDLRRFSTPGYDARHEPERTVLGILHRPGAFAEQLTLPPECLYAVPDSIHDEEAVFVEPLAAALQILEQIHVPPGEKALVIGDGKLGLLIAQVLARHGCRTFLHGHHEKKLALARRWGVNTNISWATIEHTTEEPTLVDSDDPEDQEILRGLMELAEEEEAFHDRERAAGRDPHRIHPSDKFPLVVEATGSPAGFASALAWVQPRGTIVLKSTYAPEALPALDAAKIVVDEVRIVGSRCGRFAPALRLLAQGAVDVRALIDHRVSFERVVEGFELAARKGVLKVLVQFPAP
ncbi:MAG: zinc-binding dehydrogenase [Planctomycetes bacterium]|nr:zinc-binding dehydrogenase [Planctomycetota bacterium]